MCLIALSYGVSSEFALVLAANRDERHARPTDAADWWPDDQRILGGRDRMANGTWLAVDAGGRVAAVTNYFESRTAPAPRSRGELVTGFLRGRRKASDFGETLADRADDFAGYNLLAFDGTELHYASNRAPGRPLAPGVHALGNTDPEADWPKILRARSGMADWLAAGRPAEELFDLLAQRGGAGSGPAQHRGSLFIVGDEFGTRCSTVVLIRHDGSARFIERRFDAVGKITGETERRFTLEPPYLDAPT